MCGICGIVNKHEAHTVNQDAVKNMCDSLRHRGPDESGFYFDRQVGLGMRRLKVIDLSTGSQPIYNEDKTIVCILNGEIYNYRELRDVLQKKNHKFRTNSDTEVIVHLYEEYGEDFLVHLNGMFSIALWDTVKNVLTLSRDRMGEKPLHYILSEKGIAFSSEIKSFLEWPDFKTELDHEALYHYFSFICVPAPLSIFKDVRKLLPGHYLRYCAGKAEIKKYWDFTYNPDHTKTEEYFCSSLKELMVNSLKKRMISDVPLGAFLSGGIDSSVVVGLMSELTDAPIKTFSIGFPEQKYNELKYARIIADKFHTEHHEFVVEPSAVDLIEKLVWFFDEPFGGPSAIPTYLVSKLAREYVTVALSGDGGDEIFAGYGKYLTLLKRHKLSVLPQWMRRLVATGIGDQLPHSFLGKRFLQSLKVDEKSRHCFGLSELWKKKIFTRDFLHHLESVDSFSIVEDNVLDDSVDYLSRFMHLDTKHYLPDNVLVKVDRMSMANSLEVRTLFLDHEIVEFAATIPSNLKLDRKQSKKILKKTMRTEIPPEILNRGKWGFMLPVDLWFRNELKDLITHSISSVKNDGIFDSQYLALLLDEHQKGRRDNHTILWTFLMFQLWSDKYLK